MNVPTGIVFDVQRGSLHDGPGIRTTVFLKGCPLRCVWCHNPESQRRAPELAFDAERCMGCRACAQVCTSSAHTFTSEGRHVVDFTSCRATGACVRACPAAALKLHGAERTVAEIMAEVEKDRAYYATSGGGLTLSGGEPTTQLLFCRALLAAAREAGIHSCLGTCGIATPDAYASLRPLTDLFLFDWKATHSAQPAALTGVPNMRIRANLRALHDAGAAIVLRCPLVPGVNDDAAHLRGIAALTQEE